MGTEDKAKAKGKAMKKTGNGEQMAMEEQIDETPEGFRERLGEDAPTGVDERAAAEAEGLDFPSM